MERHGDEVELTTEEARGGDPRKDTSYVLIISLALVVLLLTVIWGTGALTSNAPDEAQQTENPAGTQKTG